jgi:hypothetical protein
VAKTNAQGQTPFDVSLVLDHPPEVSQLLEVPPQVAPKDPLGDFILEEDQKRTVVQVAEALELLGFPFPYLLAAELAGFAVIKQRLLNASPGRLLHRAIEALIVANYASLKDLETVFFENVPGLTMWSVIEQEELLKITSVLFLYAIRETNGLTARRIDHGSSRKAESTSEL